MKKTPLTILIPSIINPNQTPFVCPVSHLRPVLGFVIPSLGPPSAMPLNIDEKFAAAGKNVLVDIVKLAQKQGMKGNKGDWKDFLKVYDKKFGVSLSDPARRSTDSLVAFLKTFTEEDDLKFFDKVIQSHSQRGIIDASKNNSEDPISPEQKLVALTLGHPQYPLNYSFPSHEEGWLVTKQRNKSKAMRSTVMVAIDCEMVLCEDGTDALVRVCVVDRNLKVRLDELVKPDRAVADYRTEITGVSEKDLDRITCSLEDIQKSMMKILSRGTVLVGHSLNNDLQALKVDHARVIDTSLIFKYENGSKFRRPSLYDLCKSVLGYELRKKGTPHNCLDDACAAMKLVLAKIESGIENAPPLVHSGWPEIDMAKLLIHRIPISVPSAELHNIIPGEFTVEIKANRKAGGDKYSAFAVFKNQEQANQAFEDVDANQEEDSSGRPQKLLPFHLSTGVTGNLYICKLARNNPPDQVASNKRPSQDETTIQSKKSKMDLALVGADTNNGNSDQCENHLKEIERLKQELKEREQEISSLNKIVVALTRKQRL